MRLVPLGVWGLCWLTGILTYFISLSQGYVHECIPFIDGCTSISKTGRYGYSYFVFKALMIPVAVLHIQYWMLTRDWLRALGDVALWAQHTLLLFGVVSGIALIVYTTFLGSEGDIYRLLRQWGTRLFFLFMYLGQALLAFRCYRRLGLNRVVGWKIGLCSLVTLQLLVFALAKYIVTDPDWLENAIEWQSAYILAFLPFLTWCLWNQTGFQIQPSVRKQNQQT